MSVRETLPPNGKKSNHTQGKEDLEKGGEEDSPARDTLRRVFHLGRVPFRRASREKDLKKRGSVSWKGVGGKEGERKDKKKRMRSVRRSMRVHPREKKSTDPLEEKIRSLKRPFFREKDKRNVTRKGRLNGNENTETGKKRETKRDAKTENLWHAVGGR